MGGFSHERDRKKCEIAGFLLLCEIDVGCGGFRHFFLVFDSLYGGFWDEKDKVGLGLFEIGGHGSDLLSHGLGFDFGSGFGFDLWCFGGLVFLVFWLFSWLWICGVSVEGIFLVVGLWFW